jgi:hypothetical protein
LIFFLYFYSFRLSQKAKLAHIDGRRMDDDRRPEDDTMKNTLLKHHRNENKTVKSILCIVFGILMTGYGAESAGAPQARPDWNPPETLVHPGGLNTQARLSIAREKIAEGVEPWKSAWEALEQTDAQKDYQPKVQASMTGVHDLQNQGHAAYVLAVKWAISGDQDYADAAMRILDAWTDTVESLDMQQVTMRTGIGGIQFANAAEIIAHAFDGSAGWPKERMAKTQDWIRRVAYPKVTTGNMRSSNWGTSALGGAMAFAIFLDDVALFNYAVYSYKYGFPDEDDPTNRHKDGCCHVTDYVWHPSGQCNESGRDQAHPMGGVGHLVETAMMAWNQGVDIVSFPYEDLNDYRVVAGMEYLARYNLGYEVPWHFGMPDLCDVNPTHPHEDAVATKCRYEIAPVWEICQRLFTDIGVPHPYTKEMILSSGDQFTYYPSRKKGGRYRPETTTSDNPGMGTLLYYDPSDNTAPETAGHATAGNDEFLGGVIARLSSTAPDTPAPNALFFKLIPKDSRADRIGFKAEDIILALNGTRITTLDQFREVYDAMKSGSSVKVTLVRHQRKKSLTFTKIDE